MHRDIGETIKSFCNCLERECRKMEQNLSNAGIDITRAQGAVIGFIYQSRLDNENVYQKDIEKRFSLRRPSATNLLNRLEEKGYLTRSKDENDARAKKLVLTQKSTELVDVVIKNVMDIDKKVKKGLSKSEIECLYSVIEKMTNNLKEDE